MASIVTKVHRPPVDFADAKTPEAWRKVSQRLLDSARLVWVPLKQGLAGYAATRNARTPEQSAEYAALMEHFGAFFVLAGLAVENAIKARLLERAIARGETINTLADLKQIVGAKPGKGHNLVDLATQPEAGLVLKPGEIELLGRLATFVKWAGRYPFPNHDKDAVDERRTTRDRDLVDVEDFIVRLLEPVRLP